MAILIRYRPTRRNEQHRFSPLFSIVRGFESDAIPLSITAVATDSTTVRVTFNQPVLNNAALACVDAYRIERSDNQIALAVLSVTPEDADEPTYVDLDTPEMQDGLEYSLGLDVLGAIGGEPLTATYVGIGVAPGVEAASAETSRSVRVTFSEPMRNTAVLRDAASYTITPDVGSDARTVEGVTLEPTLYPTYVILALDGDLTIGSLNYTVTVDNAVEDVAGNPLDPAFDTEDFDGAHIPLDIDHCELAKARLASQFRTPNMEALVCIYADRAQELEQAAQDVLSMRSLTTAYGAQLDALGSILGISRYGLTDGEYILRLRAQAQVIGSSGRPDQLIDILTTLDDGFATSVIELAEHYPATTVMQAHVPANGQARGIEFSLRFLHKAKPAGTKFILEFEEEDVTLFQMMEEGGIDPPADAGLSEEGGADGGHLAEAA